MPVSSKTVGIHGSADSENFSGKEAAWLWKEQQIQNLQGGNTHKDKEGRLGRKTASPQCVYFTLAHSHIKTYPAICLLMHIYIHKNSHVQNSNNINFTLENKVQEPQHL